MASTEERLHGMSFAQLTEAEVLEIRRLASRLLLATPARLSRRTRKSAHSSARLDVRATVRAARRSGTDTTRLLYARRREQRRKLVMLCDVSGSMEPYARIFVSLLQGAVATAGAEAFVFSTRLTRLTRQLALRDPDEALARAAVAAPDWAGGTRIADSIRHFVDEHGRRGPGPGRGGGDLLGRLGAGGPRTGGGPDGAAAAPGAPDHLGQSPQGRPGLPAAGGRHGSGPAVLRRIRQRTQLHGFGRGGGRNPRRRPVITQGKRELMQIDSTFSVVAPIDTVWDTIMDFERVAGCVPGARILNKLSDDAYQVGMTVKLGPVNMQYKGLLNVIERNAAEHRAVLGGKAQETRGQGTAEATVTLQLTEEAGGTTRGTVNADLSLSGKAAAMGKGVIGSVTEQMMALFASNLQAMITAPGAAGERQQAGNSVRRRSAAAGLGRGGRGGGRRGQGRRSDGPGTGGGTSRRAGGRRSRGALEGAIRARRRLPPPAAWTPSASRRGSRRSSCPARARSWPSWRWWRVSPTGRAGAPRSGWSGRSEG